MMSIDILLASVIVTDGLGFSIRAIAVAAFVGGYVNAPLNFIYHAGLNNVLYTDNI